ncbi:hypothetical protein ES044_08060 [Polaribacter sp. IC066]|nr:hypothetical protein ES044_08060 [Polaribacter sp. IC066]
MNNFLKKTLKLGKVENFELKNSSLILFLMAPIFFGWSYFIHNYEQVNKRVEGSTEFFALLFFIASIFPFIFKKSIHYFYGWIVFLVILLFSHYSLINLHINSFNIRFILGFYAVFFGSILLLNNRIFINIYLVTVFIHLLLALTTSKIDDITYNSVLSSFSLMFIFALLLLNDSAAFRYSLADNNKVLEKSRIELKKRAEDLEEKNKDLEEFANVVSHDLRTPLGNLSALFNWLQQEIEENNKEHIEEHLKLIEKETHQMDLILQGVLKYSLQNEVLRSDEAVYLDLLVHDLKELHETDNCKITIKKELPTIAINKSQIHQVFDNLIKNSIKYNDKEVCEIEVDCTQSNDFYTFSVKDNGMGIAEEYHEKIFELFQRLDIEQTGNAIGIGLSMAKKIINRNKGEIYLESQVHIGSTFYFTLPV